MFEHITANEIAGYAVGTLLLSATISAPKIDSFISSSQRRSLGMCKKCGDLKLIACSKCKGSGLTKEGGPFNLIPIVDDNTAFRGKTKKPTSSSCSNCGAKGCFPCPECSKMVIKRWEIVGRYNHNVAQKCLRNNHGCLPNEGGEVTQVQPRVLSFSSRPDVWFF